MRRTKFPYAVQIGNCFECGFPAYVKHHVVPKSLDGTKTVPLCYSCHSKIHGVDTLKSISLGQKTRKRIREETGRCEGRVGYDTPEGHRLVMYIRSIYFKQPRHYKKLTLQQIADRLNNEGISTNIGKQWTLCRVHDIINNKRYDYGKD